MIIGNPTNGTSKIRIGDKDQYKLTSTIMDNIKSSIYTKDEVKALVNANIGLKGYHYYLHVFSLIPFRFSQWVGPIGIEPKANWWEDDTEELKAMVGEK